jgi:hypothetical protein
MGRPHARAVARHVLHERAVGAYLLLLLLLAMSQAFASRTPAVAVRLALLPLGVAAVVIGLVRLLAWLVARTSRYIVTTRRVVLQVGIAFPMSINIPIGLIRDAGARMFGDGSGEMKLTLAEEARLAWLALWPHARPWRLRRPEPLLIGLAEPQQAAAALQAMAQLDGVSVAELRSEDRRRVLEHPVVA